jgi:hypothetical protein
MTLQELERAFQDALNEAEKEHRYYERRRWPYITGTWLVRVAAGVALTLGVLLPLSSATGPIGYGWLTFDNPAQLAVACIALAGVLIGANQVFLLSATWVRYANAMMKIRTLQKIAELDWQALRAELVEPVSPADQQRAIAIFKALIVGAREIVESETASWGSEMERAVDELRTLVREQKTRVESLAQEEQNAREAARRQAAGPGGGLLRIRIEGALRRLDGGYTVVAGKQVERRTAPTSTIVITDLPPGAHRVALSAAEGDSVPVLVENAVEIKPGAIAEVTLTVPEKAT